MKRKQENPKSSHSRLWQTIIAAKLVLLAAVWFAMNGGITIGDFPLYAKGGDADAKDAAEKKDAAKDEDKKSVDEDKLHKQIQMNKAKNANVKKSSFQQKLEDMAKHRG